MDDKTRLVGFMTDTNVTNTPAEKTAARRYVETRAGDDAALLLDMPGLGEA